MGFSNGWPAKNTPSKEELQQQIKETGGKIEEIKKEIKNTTNEIEADKKAFEEYRKEFAKQLKHATAERDSLKKDYRRVNRKTSGLAYQIKMSKQKQSEHQLQQKAFADVIEEACDSLLVVLKSYPPVNTEKYITSLSFLRSEIASNEVDNGEALERFWQLSTAVDEAGQSVESYNAPSPLKSIPGHVDYLRLGYAYAAFVTQDASSGGLWVASPDSAGTWQ
jgi:chromosome segregation ATPase